MWDAMTLISQHCNGELIKTIVGVIGTAAWGKHWLLHCHHWRQCGPGSKNIVPYDIGYFVTSAHQITYIIHMTINVSIRWLKWIRDDKIDPRPNRDIQNGYIRVLFWMKLFLAVKSDMITTLPVTKSSDTIQFRAFIMAVFSTPHITPRGLNMTSMIWNQLYPRRTENPANKLLTIKQLSMVDWNYTRTLS